MAEIKTGIFAKNVQKRLNRAQEKVLQKLGKADETKDEQFEQVVINFKRQESEGARLQREMKSYMSAIKGMQQASINLTQSLHEVYEPDWHGKDDIVTIGKDCDALWEDFHNKLVDSTLLNLDGYLQQFPDLKMRVAKRSRKLIDYDSARHQLEALQVTGMKNDRKVMKAEEELKKAQKVFDELNVGLQDELPTLWDRRVGFYISTFKCVTSLEAKFHREISLVCRELYEVMTKLREQHSDKIFTIQGAPSDSGPLRLARTPSPPEDETPPESPDASSNHMLHPVSPGPPRPKSPIQGPPVPPPPKVTPTKEVAEEQIIDLFGGEFLPAPSPSQPNERPGESLLDLDFDAFQPDESVSPIPQTAVPWDMWSGNAQPTQPAADAGFVADWSADFGSMSANGDVASATVPVASGTLAEGEQVGVQGGAECWPQAESSLPAGDTTAVQDSEPRDEGDEVRSWETMTHSNLHPSTTSNAKDEADQVEVDSEDVVLENRRKSTPGLIFTNEFGEDIEDGTGDRRDKRSRSLDGSGSEYETAEEWADGGQGGGWDAAAPSFFTDFDKMNESESTEEVPAASLKQTANEFKEATAPPAGEECASASLLADDDFEQQPLESKVEEAPAPPAGKAQEHQALTDEEDEKPSQNQQEEPATKAGSPEKPEPAEVPLAETKSSGGETAPSEKMPIPSVVIEPASSNEGDDDRDADIISPTAVDDATATPQSCGLKHISPSGGGSGFPDDFLYKVETLHDFEAANSDELELKRGDVVLVVPTASMEDQEAGWLTGIKESDWSNLGVGAQRGLFPENFTQRLN
ncbi:amphiphysin isoform X2 [Gambusia affinis]|uniref:amphiphysin isoform X2 n=1 Tax=Gambusia affinis TaxID=33528 RepID=UPI001CDC754B|nr:amphiphysin isoform X2 [Gambusia affinis]